MKYRTPIVSSVFALLILVAGCGGGGGEETRTGDGQVTADGDTTTISITEVTGNGAAPGIFRDALIVKGQNFSSGMSVGLTSAAASYTLGYNLDSSTQITATLPSALVAGDYEVKISKGASTATHAVTILRGEAGVSIQSNQLIQGDLITDLCTQYTDGCWFRGGQLVKFTDGSVLFTGALEYLWVSAAGDTDSNTLAVTGIIPPSINVAWEFLSDMVARGAGYARLWMVYQRSPETLALVHDTNKNLVCEGTDEVVKTLTLTSW